MLDTVALADACDVSVGSGIQLPIAIVDADRLGKRVGLLSITVSTQIEEKLAEAEPTRPDPLVNDRQA